MTIKYSIVIPTRNKSEYLPFAIRSVLSSPRHDIELIVSNNFSVDSTASVLASFSDSRLKVISPPESLPMAGHYEFALSHAVGEWVTILGDDDAIMPYAFDSLDQYIADHPSIDIISSRRAYYFWHGCEDLYGKSVFSYSSNLKSEVRSTAADLNAALCGLRSCFDLPQVYTTSISRRSLINKIRLLSGGQFYHSIIPDMYSAVALLLSRDKYLRVQDPLFWVGTSNKSLGRSDRIYRDAKYHVASSQCPQFSASIVLSEKVSYELHSSAFGPMYIYEALLRCPFRSSYHESRNVRISVLAAVLFQSWSREKAQKIKIFRAIHDECKIFNISLLSVAFLSIYYCFKGFIINAKKRFYAVAIRLISTRGLPIGCSCLASCDRVRFPDIMAASFAVTKLRLTNRTSRDGTY